ncbi:MAG: hypothetical protein KC619_07885 [Myxococcales bacterium]|nr:hypothetical protein [Myxococcales bacterium]
MAGRTPRALALGASLAFGTCQLAACDHAPPEPPHPLASVATTTPEVPEEEPVRLDLEAEQAEIDVTTSPGFTPDPRTFAGTSAGGPVDLHDEDERCHGWVARMPDAIVRTPRPFAELVVMAASAEDLTLAVAGEDGVLRCGDDQDGTHPIVRGELAAGVYRVWVGTRQRDAHAPFVLAFSELDDALPSSL